METKITVRESAATAKHFIDIKKYNSGTGMETNITDRETSATDRHFTDIRKYNSASIIYNDDRSGATNFNCIFISKADRFTNLKKFYYKYSHICKSECVKVTVFPGSRKSNKGRKLYMRTGKSPGFTEISLRSTGTEKISPNCTGVFLSSAGTMFNVEYFVISSQM